jgi:hypothetical protein
MSIILTVTRSDSEIVSGIPEFLTIETNTPSMVFYTFDGTEPTIESAFLEGDKLYLPTSQNSVLTKIVAIAGPDLSPIFEHEWGTLLTYFTKRFDDTQGVNILPPGEEVVDSLAVNADGQPAKETSIEFQDLDIKASDRDTYKKYDSGKTSINFINFTLQLSSFEVPYQEKSSSPNDNNLDFDPKSGLIIIDGSTPEKMQSQVVKIINRPYNTMSTRSNFYNEHLQSEPILTGNLVRHFVNPQTGKMVFYYFDSRECRWIQSIQSIQPKTLNASNLVGNPRVFSWIQDPVMSKII